MPKNILVAHSDYFRNKFLSELTTDNIVHMDENLNIDVLEVFLHCLHSGTLEGYEEFAPALFELADLYLIESLKVSFESGQINCALFRLIVLTQ
jgi:hypothetical protein